MNGKLARAAGLGGGNPYGIALEGNGPLRDGQPGRATVELGVVPGGYGWVFPKDGHANYGVGGWATEGPRLREHLRRLCAAHGVDSTRLTDLHGRRLPIRAPTRARRGRSCSRRRRRARRSALRRRDLRGARSARLAAEAILRPARRLRGRARRGLGRLAAILEGEARARPPPARRLRDRAAPGRVAGHRGARHRRLTHRASPRAGPRRRCACSRPASKARAPNLPIPPSTPYGPQCPPPARRRTRRERHPPQAGPAADGASRRHDRAARRVPGADRAEPARARSRRSPASRPSG